MRYTFANAHIGYHGIRDPMDSESQKPKMHEFHNRLGRHMRFDVYPNEDVRISEYLVIYIRLSSAQGQIRERSFTNRIFGFSIEYVFWNSGFSEF